MKLKELEGKKIIIVGAGVEGNSVLRFLKTHVSSSTIDIVDKKDGPDYLSRQKDYDVAIKSPGIQPKFLTITYTTATNIFFSNARGKIIGVTGTKGKSTTATLIYEMLKKSFATVQDKGVYLGGNIGQSPLDFLDKLTDQSWTVLELSSFQLQDLKASPYVAVLLMVTSEHLDYHKDVYEYIQAKRNILRFQTPSDSAVLNKDYPASRESDIETQGQVYLVSRVEDVERGCFVRDKRILLRLAGKDREIIKTSDILLKGNHNLENVCMAVMAAALAGVSKESMVSVLKTFRGLPHRLEFVAEVRDITFYNDSLATIPEATISAIEALGEDVETLIMGGHDRGLDYKSLGVYLVKSKVKTLILFPPSGKRIWDTVQKSSKNTKRKIDKFDVSSMDEAMKIAFAQTQRGKICLLSPASASFGIFKDYKDRGDQFRKEIEKHKKAMVP